MKKFIKHITLTITLLLLCGAYLVAQDKYEYGMINYSSFGGFKNWVANVSLNDKFEGYKGTLTEGLFFENFTPVTKIISDLNSKGGWEVYDQSVTHPSPNTHLILYFLRRKVK
jgi:hypothetical protein